MFEILLRMIFQTGVVKTLSLYNIKVTTQKSFKYIFKNRKQTYIAITFGSIICGLAIFTLESCMAELGYSTNCCSFQGKKVNQMWFYSFNAANSYSYVFKLILVFSIYIGICNQIMKGYYNPWRFIIGEDESNTSTSKDEEVLNRLKIVKN